MVMHRTDIFIVIINFVLIWNMLKKVTFKISWWMVLFLSIYIYIYIHSIEAKFLGISQVDWQITYINDKSVFKLLLMFGKMLAGK